MSRRQVRGTVSRMLLLALILAASFVAVRTVLAPPPLSALPTPLSQYGVVTVSANKTSLGGSSITIRITGDQNVPFFLIKLIIVLKLPAEGDLVLDSMNIDGTGTITFSSYGMASPKVVVVAAGSTVGEVLTSLPSYVDSIFVKEPMGNNAIVANGGDGNGLTFVLHFTTLSFTVMVSAIAVVTAPSNNAMAIDMF